MITNTIAALLPWSSHSTATAHAEGFRHVQKLSYQAAVAIGDELAEGWTEKQAAAMLGTYLKDHGIKAFFHEPYAWFGDRTRFDGIRVRNPRDFAPTERRLHPGDPVILDVAPLLNGYVGDIGYTLSLGENPAVTRALDFLRNLRRDIPALFDAHLQNGGEVWRIVDKKFHAAGYDNIHSLYPFHVLGHRLRRVPLSDFALRTPVGFSLHSFYQLLTGGFFAELLNADHQGDLKGFWAIEPHLGGPGFGAKFEEILVIDDKGSRWLSEDVPHAQL